MLGGWRCGWRVLWRAGWELGFSLGMGMGGMVGRAGLDVRGFRCLVGLGCSEVVSDGIGR